MPDGALLGDIGVRAQPHLAPAGDGALLVTLADAIGDTAHCRVRALDGLLAAAAIPGVVEWVPAYTTLLVLFDPVVAGHAEMATRVAPLAAGAMRVAPGAGRRSLDRRSEDGGGGVRTWRIPVAYGGAVGEDLAPLADRLGIAPDALVAAHSGATYTVYMLGFLPGFAYLGGLPEGLAAPRRATPRQRVPAGSVAIGGAQTAIWPIDGPCGWHVIGSTPCRTFARGDRPGSFLSIGDRIVLEPVGRALHAALEVAAARGARIAEEIT
ncbi:MAG: 5-oxoprolinase subunit PxpB [Hyphomicrobiaceae bacterium]